METNNLSKILESCTACTKCDIRDTIKQVVFGTGPINPAYMIVGEAPGFNEDIDGEPFTGKAGQLLMRLVGEVWGLTRNDIYFANCLKCRPPENRDPTKEEFMNCQSWLHKQIAAVNPKGILTVGKYGTMAVAGEWKDYFSMGKTRSAVTQYYNIPVVATWHPAYCLRNPSKTPELSGDMKLLEEAIKQKNSISIW